MIVEPLTHCRAGWLGKSAAFGRAPHNLRRDNGLTSCACTADPPTPQDGRTLMRTHALARTLVLLGLLSAACGPVAPIPSATLEGPSAGPAPLPLRFRDLPEGHPVRPLQAAKGGPRTVPVSFRESPGPPPFRDAPRGRDGRDGVRLPVFAAYDEPVVNVAPAVEAGASIG